jgi:hypothetical protein
MKVPFERTNGPSLPIGIASRPATSSMSAHLLKNRLIAEEISGGHAYAKHVIKQNEFPNFTQSQFTSHIEKILNNPSRVRELRNERMAYWHQETGTIVIRNPAALDGGSAFKPIEGIDYFEKRIR